MLSRHDRASEFGIESGYYHVKVDDKSPEGIMWYESENDSFWDGEESFRSYDVEGWEKHSFVPGYDIKSVLSYYCGCRFQTDNLVAAQLHVVNTRHVMSVHGTLQKAAV